MKNKLDIVFEDENLLVVHKAAGLVVNRSLTSTYETLQDQLSSYLGLGEKLGLGDRAGIVHRIDKETSGLLVVAKTKSTFEELQRQFKDREVEKKYIALVHGLITVDEGFVEQRIMRIGSFGKFGVAGMRDIGREARTDFKVEKRYTLREEEFSHALSLQEHALNKSRINYLKKNAQEYCLLSVFPKTGRTHQIRVHLKSIGHPIVSDLLYDPGKLIKFDLHWCPRLFLHAAFLKFKHPKTKKEIFFESKLPKDIGDTLKKLEPVSKHL